MRKHLFISAVAVVALAGLAIPASADAKNGGHVRKVRLQDRCDPATFNATFGDGVCMPHNGELITAADFLAKANPTDGGHPKWNFHPDEMDLKMGDSISASVRGGEFHTFTEVPMFGPGCFQPLNDLLGLAGPPVVDCSLLGTTGTVPGAPPVVVSDLTPGTHLFMCLIHPWMKSVVNVRD
jgi:plastocyanin